jgi:hypothetical protein
VIEFVKQRSLLLVGFLLKQALAIAQQRFLGVARVGRVLYAPIDFIESTLEEFSHGRFLSHREFSLLEPGIGRAAISQGHLN